MQSQVAAIRIEQAENDNKMEKMNKFKKFLLKKKLKKVNGPRHTLVVQEFKALKKYSDDQCKVNAPQLIEEFRRINAASLDSDDDDDEVIFNDFIYQKEEDNWDILFKHLNQFKEDKKMKNEETFRALIKSYTS